MGWKDRYCVLDGHKFYYYKNKTASVPDGVIDFNLISCYIEE